MEIKFIGTGSGKTSLKRFHSSFIILADDFNLLVDAGDGISKALLHNKISFEQIDGILFTHLHPDHFSGFAALIVQMKLINRTKKIKIFVHESLSKFTKDFLFNSYLFEEKMDFEIDYELFQHNVQVLVSDKIKFISKQNSHLDQYIRYDKEKKLSFISSSILFELDKKKLFYSGDIGSVKDLFLFEDNHVSRIITETTHLNKAELLTVLEKFKPEEIYLTHISDEGEYYLKEWKDSLSEGIRNKFVIAYDGMAVRI